MFLKALAGYRNSHQSKVDNRPLEFIDNARRVVDHILEWQQADRFQSWIAFADIGNKVVIGTTIGKRVVPFRRLAHAKTGGGKEHRYTDALDVHVVKPRRQIIIFQSSQTAAH